MNVHHDVTIVCGERALRLLSEVYKKYDFIPEKGESGKFWILKWWDVCWDRRISVIKEIEQVLQQLDAMVTEDKEFAYKQFILEDTGEEICTRWNSAGDVQLYDYYMQRSLYDPKTYEEGRQTVGFVDIKEILANFLDGFLKENPWEDATVQKQAAVIFTAACLVGNIGIGTEEYNGLVKRFYWILQKKYSDVSYDVFNSMMEDALHGK